MERWRCPPWLSWRGRGSLEETRILGTHVTQKCSFERETSEVVTPVLDAYVCELGGFIGISKFTLRLLTLGEFDKWQSNISGLSTTRIPQLVLRQLEVAKLE